MNFIYPVSGVIGNPNSFIADNTHDLGSFDTYINEISILSVDYSQLSPLISPTNVSFRISPGGMPGLGVVNASLSGTMLLITLINGNPGVTYTMTINLLLATGEIRTDILTVNVIDPNADGICCSSMQEGTGIAAPPIQTSGDGLTFVNTAPRWYVSGTPPVAPNVMDRWYSTTNGYVYEYETNGLVSQWVVAGEGPTPLPPIIPPVPIQPPTPAGAVPIIKMYPILPDGVAQTFSLLALDGTIVNIDSPEVLLVFVDGVWQEAEKQYTTNINQIIFFEPPRVDSLVWILWFSPGAVAMTTSVVKMLPLAPDGTLTNFTLVATDSSTVNVQQVNTLFVSQDGVWQEPTVQFNAAGNQISFVSAPTADSYIFILWFRGS